MKALLRVTQEDLSVPRKIDHGTRDGVVVPLIGIGFEFRSSPLECRDSQWFGVWLKTTDTKEQVAERLDQLAKAMRETDGVVGEGDRTGNLINEAEMSDLLAKA